MELRWSTFLAVWYGRNLRMLIEETMLRYEAVLFLFMEGQKIFIRLILK